MRFKNTVSMLNRTEQNRTEQNRTSSLNFFKISFVKTKINLASQEFLKNILKLLLF